MPTRPRSSGRGYAPCAAVARRRLRAVHRVSCNPGLAMTPAHLPQESRMATIPVIDALDRCKIALQYVAEMQSNSLDIVLELLLEQLEEAIGQAHAQLRQCTCADTTHPRVVCGPAPHGVLTLLPRSRQTPTSLGAEDAEERDAEEEHLCPDV